MDYIEKRTILGTYEPGHFFTQTHFSDEEMKLGLQKKTAQEYWYVSSTLYHEWFHHLQIIGSSFGYHYLNIVNASGYYFTRYLKNITENRSLDNLLRPLYKNNTDDDDFEVARSLVHYRKGLLGKLDETESKEKDIFASCMLRGIEAPKEEVLPVIKPKSSGNHHYIGALQIMEGHAHANEMAYLRSFLSEEKYSGIEALYPINPYRILQLYTSERLKEYQVDILSLFRLICDIALNPDADNKRERGETVLWEDFHPGWRFIKIIDYLESLKEKRNNFFEIYLSIFWHFDWETPDAVLKELNTNLYRNKNTDWYKDDVIRLRKENPLCFSLLYENDENLIEFFPHLIGRNMPGKKLQRDDLFHYEATSLISSIYERTILEILFEDSFTCTLHNTKFPPAKKCKEPCAFIKVLESKIGFSIEQYLSTEESNIINLSDYR